MLNFVDEDEAFFEARQMAVEEYRTYEGLHGLRSFEDIVQDYIDDGIDPDEIDEAEIESELEEEMESWLDYEVIPVPDDYEMSEDEIDEIS